LGVKGLRESVLTLLPISNNSEHSLQNKRDMVLSYGTIDTNIIRLLFALLKFVLV